MIDWKDWKTYLFILIPAVTGYITGMKCKVGKDAGSTIPARPPARVFGTVWPILYALLGVTWVILRNYDQKFADTLMTINTVGLVAWIYMYSCKKDKKRALYIILGVLLVGLMLFGYAWSVDKNAGKMMTPFVVWIIFAMMLNYTEVNQK